MQYYLIKKSNYVIITYSTQLLVSFFYTLNGDYMKLYLDIIIFSISVVLTILLGSIIGPTSISDVIIVLIPILTGGFLVFPIPNYHNTRVLIKEVYVFLFKARRRYIWRGWCYKYEQPDE